MIFRTSNGELSVEPKDGHYLLTKGQHRIFLHGVVIQKIAELLRDQSPDITGTTQTQPNRVTVSESELFENLTPEEIHILLADARTQRPKLLLNTSTFYCFLKDDVLYCWETNPQHVLDIPVETWLDLAEATAK